MSALLFLSIFLKRLCIFSRGHGSCLLQILMAFNGDADKYNLYIDISYKILLRNLRQGSEKHNRKACSL